MAKFDEHRDSHSTYVCRTFWLCITELLLSVCEVENKTKRRFAVETTKVERKNFLGTTARIQQHLHIICRSTPIYKLATAGPRNFIAAS